MTTPIQGAEARFLAYVEGRERYSQLLQDLWVLHSTGEQRGGFFVEFGACDGRAYSNTLLLEERFGWRGILAEPSPVWWERLQRNRPGATIDRRCVYSASGQRLPFVVPRQAELGGLTATAFLDSNSTARRAHLPVVVETVSLLDLLRTHGAPKVIDYLSIDTEGSELEILSGFDFDAYRFRLLSVEHNHTPARDQIRRLLERHGYHRTLASLSKWDDWYFDPVLLGARP